jgi:flagellar protein FlgJ
MSDVIFNDIGFLGALRAEANAAPNKALEEVASQFEALFLQQMMKSMRDAVPKGDLMNSDHMETFQSMADQQMSLSLSREGGIGLARMLVEQLQTRGLVSEDRSNPTEMQAGNAIGVDATENKEFMTRPTGGMTDG